MDDFSDFDRILPVAPPDSVARTRARLRDAYGRERRRRRREWFFVRAVAVGVVIFTVWSISPATPTDSDLPLVGLAQATAQLARPTVDSGQQWYIREVRSERRSIVDRTGVLPNDITFMVNTVAETWVDPETEVVRRSSSSHIELLSPDDQVAYERLHGQESIGLERIEDEPIEIAYPGVHPVWSQPPSVVYDELASGVGSQDDIRLERLEVLKAATRLIQYHGIDPAKRSTLLYTIAEIPGIEVDRSLESVSVRYQYVVKDVAQEIRFDFDPGDGRLLGESITTLATPTSPEIVLSQSRYEARLEIDAASNS